MFRVIVSTTKPEGKAYEYNFRVDVLSDEPFKEARALLQFIEDRKIPFSALNVDVIKQEEKKEENGDG